MNLRDMITSAMVATCATAVGLGVYDRFVRIPHTPRLAVVDVAKLYALAERKATSVAVSSLQGGANDPSTTAMASLSAQIKTGADFGPALESTMRSVAQDCTCTLVAMAAVVGADTSVPDFTDEVAKRLRLVVQTEVKP